MKKLHVNSWSLYEKSLKEAKHRVAIDAGANDGGYTDTLSRAGFFVFAFEPVPEVYQKLIIRHGNNPECSLINCGLSDKSEIIEGVTVLEAWTIGRPGDGGLSVKPEMVEAPEFDMHTVALDEFICDLGVGIIKLDVDGYELKVLRGAEKTIRQFKPPILCEFGNYLKAVGDTPEDLVRYIFSLGYVVVSCDGNNVFTSWDEIEPQYPYHTTFDVMLMPI